MNVTRLVTGDPCDDGIYAGAHKRYFRHWIAKEGDTPHDKDGAGQTEAKFPNKSPLSRAVDVVVLCIRFLITADGSFLTDCEQVGRVDDSVNKNPDEQGQGHSHGQGDGECKCGFH